MACPANPRTPDVEAPQRRFRSDTGKPEPKSATVHRHVSHPTSIRHPATGFSQMACLPARTASSETETCSAGGRQISTISIAGSARTDARSPVARAPVCESGINVADACELKSIRKRQISIQVFGTNAPAGNGAGGCGALSFPGDQPRSRLFRRGPPVSRASRDVRDCRKSLRLHALRSCCRPGRIRQSQSITGTAARAIRLHHLGL